MFVWALLTYLDLVTPVHVGTSCDEIPPSLAIVGYSRFAPLNVTPMSCRLLQILHAKSSAVLH